MKRIIVTVFGMLMMAFTFAQTGNHLDKPRSKSMKQEEVRIKHVVTRAQPLQLKGPAAKHRLRRGPGDAKVVPVVRSARMSLKGPGAKNYRPQIKKSSPNIFRHSSRKE